MNCDLCDKNEPLRAFELVSLSNALLVALHSKAVSPTEVKRVGQAGYRSITDLVPLAVATSSVGLREIELSQDVPIPNGAVSDSRPLVSIMS